MTDQPSPYSMAAVEPPWTRCARCGLIEVCGEREDEPVCSRCVWEMLDETRRERDELRGAARAVVDAFSSNAPERCRDCDGVATSWDSWGSVLACDAHARAGAKDYPYAPAWRRLVAMVKP